ncbi:hypothetical protein [Sphingomonas beigongshangi]|uniref:hypothetical protein n=1 Tax=Sphingomonas beigongshangi TaxID=2782540 RepID=UPI00193C5D54|nr:hypothetical protein [Sphingomonas beigongshangi]
MSRNLPQALADAIADRVVRPFLAVHIDFPDPIFAWTGRGTIRFNDEDWTGIHSIGAIDTIGEDTDGSATGVKATLSEVPANFRDDIADQAVRGCLYELFVGALDETYQQVVGYKLIWKGRLGSYEIVDGGETLTVTAGGESRQIDQRRPSIKRFTDERQQRQYPGDRFFEYLPRMTEIPILWAKTNQSG